MKNKKKAGPKGVFQRADKLWSRVTGREHQYCVRLAFRPKGWQGNPITLTLLPSVTYRPSPATFYRALRKHYGPGFLKQIEAEGIPLQNGRITFDSITYLGRH